MIHVSCAAPCQKVCEGMEGGKHGTGHEHRFPRMKGRALWTSERSGGAGFIIIKYRYLSEGTKRHCVASRGVTAPKGHLIRACRVYETPRHGLSRGEGAATPLAQPPAAGATCGAATFCHAPRPKRWL